MNLLYIHSTLKNGLSLSLSLSLQAIIVILTHCKCTLFFVVVRMQWDFWFSFGVFFYFPEYLKIQQSCSREIPGHGNQ